MFKVNELLKKTVVLIFSIGCFLTCTFFFAQDLLIQLFINDPSVNALGIRFLQAGLIAGPISGFYQLAISFLQSTGKPSLSALLSLLKDVVIYVPVLYLMDLLFNLSGLVYAGSLSTILAALTGVLMAVHRYRQLQTEYA